MDWTCITANETAEEEGMSRLAAGKLQICPKHLGLFYFQHRTRICPKTELPLDEFLGLMGSKFEHLF